MPIERTTHRRRAGRWPAAVLAAAGWVALAGCEVTNPGPVADANLDRPTVHQALVNGAGRKLSQALSFVGYTGALSAREIIAGGQTGNGGHDPTTQAGHLLPSVTDDHWEYAHHSRWIAEDAIRRFKTLPAGEVDAAVFAEAYLWAGYANRLLGENFCDAIFDGGGKEANLEYFKRAQQHFTDALAKAPATAAGSVLKQAAYAGRASVRVWMKDWPGAVADANQVPLDFSYLVNADEASQDTRNQIYFSSSNTPYRGFSVWNTWFATYYEQTGDPRVPWGKNPSIPFANAQLSGYGQVPWWFQLKYKTSNDDISIASGREMALVRAEAALLGNDWQGAMTLINSLRTSVRSDKTGQPLEPWVATNATEAWTFLKRERGIELWLEARRLGDIRRWEENGTPGALDWPNFESLSALFRNNPPSRCFPTPESELDTNPNL